MRQFSVMLMIDLINKLLNLDRNDVTFACQGKEHTCTTEGPQRGKNLTTESKRTERARTFKNLEKQKTENKNKS